ncbi:MAG: hypothetical protein CMM50_12090 [Rhodospirillaceae bacterium]|nr:hypothetical protein [Rhodospirillaceae bacterium]
MAMRSVFFGFLVAAVLAVVAPAVHAADSETFEVMGFKLGATAGEIETAAKSNKLTTIHITRGPSFEQAVKKARRQMVQVRDYAGVQIIRAESSNAAAVVTFAPTPDGPRAVKIVYDVMPGGIDVSALEAQLVANHGKPDLKDERGWVWGDTAAFYSRKSAYLELRPHPVSAGARKPDATLILADPSLQKRSEEAISDKAAQGS